MFFKQILIALLWFSIECLSKAPKAKNGYKNILFIVADDLGKFLKPLVRYLSCFI
jgi:hypothetical protein